MEKSKKNSRVPLSPVRLHFHLLLATHKLQPLLIYGLPI